MNIKEHIEAGHYPVDDKGRALVPTRSGVVATILATDVGDNWTIVGNVLGHVYRWNENGVARGSEPGYAGQLLPPPPRKVEMKRWAIVATWDGRPYVPVGDTYATQEEARKAYPGGHLHVELTGEYEEPWS